MIEIGPYQAEWVGEFERLGATIRSALGSLAISIHHIGSTSVPGLVAKDVIDIQLTVAGLNAAIDEPLRSVDFVVREGVFEDHLPPGMILDPAQLQKRYCRYLGRRVHPTFGWSGGSTIATRSSAATTSGPIPSPPQPTVRSSANSRAGFPMTRARTTTSRTPCST